MSEEQRRARGWYPDGESGGTKYWDGFEWSGHRRPPRRTFAAKSSHRIWGIVLVVFGGFYLLSSFSAFSATSEGFAAVFAAFLLFLVVGGALLAGGIFLLRGQGPTMRQVNTEIEAYRAERRARAPLPTSAPSGMPIPPVTGGSGSTININLAGGAAESAAAEQMRVLADPETSASLLNLQNLLYTRTITEAEYQAAKDRLFADHSE